MRNFLSTLFFSLVVGGVWGQVAVSITGAIISPVAQNNFYITSTNASLSSNFQLSYVLNSAINEISYTATILSVNYYIGAVQESSQWQDVDTTALPSTSSGSNFVIDVTGLPSPSTTGYSASNPVSNSVITQNLTAGLRYRVFTVVKYRVVTYDDMDDEVATYYGVLNTSPILIHTYPNNLSVVSNYNACLDEVPSSFFATPSQMYGNSYSVKVERKNSQGLWFDVSNTAFSNQLPPSNSTYTNDFRVSLSLHYPFDAYDLNEQTVVMPTQSFTFTFNNPNILYLNSNPLKINSISTTNPTSLSLFVRSATTSATTNTRIYIGQILSNSSFIGYRSQISPLVSGSNINSSGNRFFASAPPTGMDFNVNINNTSNITVDGVFVPVTAQIQPVNSTWYYYFEYTAACGTSSAWFPIFRLPTPTTTWNGVNYSVQNVCSTVTLASLKPLGISIDGKSYEWAFFATATATTPLADGTTVSAGTYFVRYRYVDNNNVSYFSDTYTSITVNVGSLYTGPTGTALAPVTQAQFDNPLNWCPNGTPTNPIIKTTVYVDGSYNYTNLTVECGGSLIITETGRVNITNVLTNGGLVQIINGGTIKYGTTVAQIGTCNGTYEYKESFPASSRFWYLGSTITNATRESFGVVGSASSGTQMWYWTEATQGYTSMGTANDPLTVGRGYVWKNNSGSTMNVTLTGTYNSAPVTISSLSRQGTGSSSGFHLISNPYTSYLDIHQVLGGINTSPTNLFSNPGTQNMWRDAWVRSINSGGTMIFDAYNATSGIGTGTSTIALSSGLTPTSVGRWIAPMQGVWVRVKPGMTGSVYMDNTMTNPNPAGAGQLRSASAVEGLARINVVYGNQIDQMVAALSPNASNAQDAYDTEKMFITNYVQVYAPNTGKKFAINTLKNSKSKVSMPITIECPGSGWYSINLAELELPNGVLFLEDKLNGEMKDLTIDSSYQFFANSGVLATRFVLHFHLPTIVANPAGPSSMDDMVSETQNAVIDIRANGSGKVNVSLDMVDEETNSFVRICDMNGRMLESFQINGSSFEFQMNHGQGIYLVEVSNGLTVEKKKVFVQ